MTKQDRIQQFLLRQVELYSVSGLHLDELGSLIDTPREQGEIDSQYRNTLLSCATVLENNQTPYARFVINASLNPTEHRGMLREDDGLTFFKHVDMLQTLQNKMSGFLLIYLFGHELGEHLWTKYCTDHNRNMLSWLNNLTAEYRLFILYQVKSNDGLYAYC